MAEESEKDKFMKKLADFHESCGVSMTSSPTIAKHPLDLYLLYTTVKERGGFAEVCRLKLWKEIALLCNIMVDPSSAYAIKKQYNKHLLDFECKYDRGGISSEALLSQNAPKSKKNKAVATAEEVTSPTPGDSGYQSQGSFINSGRTDSPFPGYSYPSAAGPNSMMGAGPGPGGNMGNMPPGNLVLYGQTMHPPPPPHMGNEYPGPPGFPPGNSQMNYSGQSNQSLGNNSNNNNNKNSMMGQSPGGQSVRQQSLHPNHGKSKRKDVPSPGSADSNSQGSYPQSGTPVQFEGSLSGHRLGPQGGVGVGVQPMTSSPHPHPHQPYGARPPHPSGMYPENQNYPPIPPSGYPPPQAYPPTIDNKHPISQQRPQHPHQYVPHHQQHHSQVRDKEREDQLHQCSKMTDEKDRFMKKLAAFRGLSTPVLILEDQPLNLFLLYNSVKRYGGHEEVCRKRNWKAVASLCRINVNSLKAMRHIYTKYLLCIEEDEAQPVKNDDPTCTVKVDHASQPSLPHLRPLPPIHTDSNVSHTDDSRLTLNNNNNNHKANDPPMNGNLRLSTSHNLSDFLYHRYLVSQVPTFLDTDRLCLSGFGYLQLIDWIYILDGFKIVYKDVYSDKEIAKMHQCADFIFEQVEEDGIKELLKYGALEKLISDWRNIEKNKKFDLNFFDPLQRELEALMTNLLRKFILTKRIQEKKCSLIMPHSKSSISLDKSVASMDSAYYSDYSQITAPSEFSASLGNRGYRELLASRSHASENNHNLKSLPKIIPFQKDNLKFPTLNPRKNNICILPSKLDLDDPNFKSLTDKLKNLETS